MESIKLKNEQYIDTSGVFDHQELKTQEELNIGFQEDIDKTKGIVEVSDTQPEYADNKLWIKPDGTEVEIPDMEDVANINKLIPDAASDANKLTDENRVNTIINAKLSYYRTAAAQKSVDDAQDLVIRNKQATITASGILKGDGNGGVSAAIAGSDYVAPLEVEDLKNANDYVIKTKAPDTFEAVPFLSSGGFVKGRINTTTGGNVSSTTRARRYNSILSGNYVSLGTDDYEYTLFYYDGIAGAWTDTYTHVYSDWINGSVWTLIDDSIGDRARIIVRHPDDSEISDADLDILTRVCVARNLNQITPQITTKKGNPVYIGELEALARDWYSHRNDIVGGSKAMVYGNNSILNTSSYTREIDCSTFVGMLLRGYSFSQTPYATGQGANPDSWTGNTAYNWTFNPFDYSNYSRIDSQSRTKVRYASQMAEMMIERGQTVPIDRYYANIEPGDVLFFARHDSTTNDWFEPLRFKHINHVAICIAKEKAISADGWDTATYPWKHTFAEVGHEDETTPDGVIKIRTLEQPQGDASAIFENNINTLCLVCRPDLGSISDDYTDLSEDVCDLKSDFNMFETRNVLQTQLVRGSYIKGSGNGAGTPVSHGKFVRIKALIAGFGEKISIELTNPTYEYYVSYYGDNGALDGTDYLGYSGYNSTIFVIPEQAKLIGITFRRVDQGELTSDALTEISNSLYFYGVTDISLSESGKSADAKATGTAIENAGIYWSHDVNYLIPTYDGLIAKYDELCSMYPQYITKNTLTSGDFTNYEYVLTIGNYNSQNGQRGQDAEIAKPTILISSGVHGYERSSVMGLYGVVKAMCENVESLNKIIYAANYRIIPIVCPWGYTNDSRVNNNGVNINRNFDTTDWTLLPEGPQYSGTEPANQPETKVMQTWLETHNDALIYIDWHNSGYLNEISCLLGLNTTETTKWKKKYLTSLNNVIPWWMKGRNIPPTNIYAYTGAPTVEYSNPGTAVTYAREHNIETAFVLETSWNVIDTGKHSKFSLGVGQEAFANMMIGFADLINGSNVAILG